MKNKQHLQLAILFALLAVVLGAFGAHGLKNSLSAYQIGIFETGVRYQFYHAIALLVVFLLSNHLSGRYTRWAGICFTVGILLFSGSLYLLACHELIGIENKRWLGPLTPIGGLFFIIGWASLLLGTFKKAW